MPPSAAPAVLGIDLGTSSVKVMLVSWDEGTLLAQADTSYSIDRPNPGWAEIDPRRWWAAIRSAVARVTSEAPAHALTGIGLSGQMHGVVLCDDRAVPTRPAVLWPDTRSSAELAGYRGLDPAIRATLGNPLSPGMAGPILGWLQRNEPESLRAAHAALQPKDWVRAQLTGQLAAEASDASATLLYDLSSQAWSPKVVAALGIRGDLLPPILAHSFAPAGTLTPAAAIDLGLNAGIPVVAGAADTAAALLGSGLTEAGVVQLTIGTGVQIVTPVHAPTTEQLLARAAPVTHLYRAARPDSWYAMAAGLTGGQTLQWVRGILGVNWSELYAAADFGPTADDPVFLPHLVGERTPYLDTGMRGAWTGLSPRHERRDLLYAALEGVAFAVADGLDALRESGIRTASDLRLAGGGTTQSGWRQLLADVLMMPLRAVEVPAASARGAALLVLGVDASGRLSAEPTTGAGSTAVPGPRSERLQQRRQLYLDRLRALRHSG